MGERVQIAGDIPLERAWKDGRRVYVVCGFKSRLSDDLYALGSHWDREEKATWVGSGKLDQVVTLVRQADERAAATEQVKSAGLYVKIPFDAAGVREQAKRLGARWDSGRKEWAMPAQEALDQVTALVAGYGEKAAKAKATEKATANARKDRRNRPAGEVIAASGRKVIDGSIRHVTEIMGYRGKRAGVEQYLTEPGEVIKVREGRFLVLASKAEFWSEDTAEDFAPGTGAGWREFLDGVLVEPDEAEKAEEAAKAAAGKDGESLATGIEAIKSRLELAPEVEARQPRVPEGELAGTVAIRLTGSTGGSNGELTVARDGTVFWYHPGFYDDWRATLGTSSDPEVAEMARWLLAPGTRTRAHGGYRYEVKVTGLPEDVADGED